MKIIIIFLCILKLISMLEVTFEMIEIQYFNRKYFNSYAVTLRRASRKSPYMLNMYQDFVKGIGNNLTYNWTLYEMISGRNVLTPIRFEYRLCDFLYKDQYFGKMLANQLPLNWKCPFPAGVHNWTNIKLNFDFAPYIPFTYSSLFVRVCSFGQTNFKTEIGFKIKICSAVKQKLRDKEEKKKPRPI